MTTPKKRPATVSADPSVDAFPPAVPRDEGGHPLENVEVTPEQLRALNGAMDLPSAVANQQVRAKTAAIAAGNPTNVVWAGVDPVQKYDATMHQLNNGTGARVSLRCVMPITLQNTYPSMPGEQLPTYDDMVRFVRDTYWNGEAATFEWAIRVGSLIRSKDTFPLARDEAAIAAWRNRTAPTPSPTYPQHLGAPPMQQPPWGPPPPPHGYSYQQQPPPPAPAPPPAQPIVVQAPAPAPQPAEVPRVSLPGGMVGYVVNGQLMVPASEAQPVAPPAHQAAPPQMQPFVYQPPAPATPPPPAEPLRLKMPDGQIGYVVNGELMVPVTSIRQPPTPPAQPQPQAPTQYAPQYAPPSQVSGPPGLPAMPPPIQAFWNPYKQAWDYPQFQPPAPPPAPSPGQVGAAPAASPGTVMIPGDDMSALARGLSQNVARMREVSNIVQGIGPMFGLTPAAAVPPVVAPVVDPLEGQFKPEDPFFDWGFFRTLKKGDGTPDMDFSPGHLAMNADKISDHIEKFQRTRMEAAELKVRLEREQAETERIRLDNEMRRRALEDGPVRQGGGFPVPSQESSPSLPARTLGGFDATEALYGPPPDENPSESPGGEGPTQAELPRRLGRAPRGDRGEATHVPIPDAGHGGTRDRARGAADPLPATDGARA